MDAPNSGRKVALSYEVIYELVRQEKLKKELRPLESDFVEQLSAYLQEKDASYQAAAVGMDVFSLGEREKLQVQIQNIRRLVRELYDRRERKIVEMALNRSKLTQDLVDTTNLLEPERQLYEKLIEFLMDNRKIGILSTLSRPGSGSAPLMNVPAPQASAEQVVTDALMQDKKSVRFITFTPSFVDSSMEPYGPFEENQTATLPVEVAELLISQGNAVEIETP